MNELPFFAGFFLGAAFLVGAVLGSFASMASWRLPRRQSWMGRSYCDQCQIMLRPRDLIPLLTWLWRRGSCRCGRYQIGWRYPLLEAGCGIGLMALLAAYGLEIILLPIIAVFVIWVILLIIHYEQPLFIPMPLLVGLAVSNALLALLGGTIILALMCIIVGIAIFMRLDRLSAYYLPLLLMLSISNIYLLQPLSSRTRIELAAFVLIAAAGLLIGWWRQKTLRQTAPWGLFAAWFIACLWVGHQAYSGL